MHVAITLQIDFTDEWYAREKDLERFDEAQDDFLDIDGVNEVCLDHCCWVKCDVAHVADIPGTSERIIHEIRKVIDRISI